MSYLPNDFRKEELLVDEGVFIRAKMKRFKGSHLVHIAVPVVAYRYEVRTNSYHADFISNAVCRLRDFYTKNGLIYCIDAIAKDLGLSKSLVKAVIKEDTLSQSVVEEDFGERRDIKNISSIVLFDRIGQRFLPNVLSVDDYESKKASCDDLTRYQPSIGDSNRYFVHKLWLPSGIDTYPLTPNDGEVSVILRQRASAYGIVPSRSSPSYNSESGSDQKDADIQECKRTSKNEKPLFDIIFSGISEERYLVTTLYYDKINTVEYCAENPFSSGRAPWVLSDVKKYLATGYPVAEKLMESLRKLEDSIDRTATLHMEQQSPLWQLCEKYLADVYGEETLNGRPELKEKMVSAFEKYTNMIHFCQSDDTNETRLNIEKSRREYYVSVQNLIEIVFAHAFRENYDINNEMNYSNYLEQAEISDYCLYDYRKLAREIGFDESVVSKSIKIGKADVDYAINYQPGNSDMYVHIFCSLLEAKFNEQHPLRKVASEYPNLFEFLSELEYLRNRSKHGNRGEIPWNSLDFQKFAFTLFNLLVSKPKEGVDVIDFNKFANHEGAEGDYQRIDSEAKNEVQKFPYLQRNPDAYYQALALERAFVAQSGEYYSKAYNMIDEVLKQLVVLVSDRRNGVDRKFLDSTFHGEYTKDGIAQKTEMVLLQYGCTYHFRNRYDEDNFKKANYSAKLTLGNRVYYFILMADYRKPELLRRFLTDNPQFLSSVEKITDPVNGRGHSNLTDFAKADIATLHSIVMDSCEKIAAYIEDLEGEYR